MRIQGHFTALDGTQFPFFERLLAWQKAGKNFTVTGYGQRIPTTFCIKDGNKIKRVYAICYGNASSLYFNKGAFRVFLH